MDLAINRHTAAVLESVVGNLDARLDRMVAIQMQAYPTAWTEAERREMAEDYLFGRREEAPVTVIVGSAERFFARVGQGAR